MSTSLQLVNTAQVSTTQQRSLSKSFTSNFITDAFLSELVTIALYPADFGSGSSLMKKESIIEYIKSFLKDLSMTVQKQNFSNQQQIKKQVGMISSILTIRESSSANINYDNIYSYISPPDLAGKKIINTAIQNKIETIEVFKENLSNIINTINCYNEIMSISNNLQLYDHLTDSIEQSTQSVFESIKAYRDLIITSYNDLSKLQILNKIDKQSDYYVLKNKESTKGLSRSLVEYISDSYSFFKTGYELFDKNVDGFESASIHIVSAPSNHGKSIFLINLLRNILTNNIDDFEEDSAVLLITLEDNIPKVTRRISSILGNCSHNVIKNLYREGSQRIRQAKNTNSDIKPLQESLCQIFDSVLIKAIDNVTQFKTSIVIKYCNENSFSPGDLSKFVDQLRVTDNLNVKLIVMDYIDCARPTMDGFKAGDDYFNQGQIVHELRQLSVNLDIPIITATQNTRESENLNGEMTNRLVGDSYKKVRFTDYLYMCRMCNNKTFLDNDVAYDVLKDASGAPPSPQDLVAYESLCNVLKVYECKITKCKEGVKDKSKYMLFCTENLRIYDSVEQYVRDSRQLKINTRNLENEIMQMSTMSSIPSFDEIDFLNQEF